MKTYFDPAARIDRLSLTINQALLDCPETCKQQVERSGQAERLFAPIFDELKNRAWAERNADALAAHGRDIAATGLAGAEFERA